MRRGCLVIHGLTEVPACVEPIRAHLEKEGFKTIAPLLAGHGKTLDDLEKSTWHEWYESVRNSYKIMAESCEKIFCVGNSMGSLLSLKLALDEKPKIKALALISTPLVFYKKAYLELWFGRHTLLGYLIRAFSKNIEETSYDLKGQIAFEALSVSDVPTASVFQIIDLQKHLRKNMRNIDCPVLLLHSKSDYVAPLRNVKLIKKMISSETVEAVIFEKSGHAIPLDSQRKIAADAIANFFFEF